MLDNNPTDDSTARRLGEDDRAVSEIIGTILVFGILIALLVLIQVSAVPAWNQQVEYEHNKRVQEDIQELGSTLTAASADGNDRSTVIEMGVQYPTRPFLFNPPPAGGTLETASGTAGGPSGSIVISNSSVVGVDNYPYGADQTISAPTKAIRYRPDYNQYGNAPETVIENGVVYNRYDDAVLTMDDGNVVNGSNINLVAVDGELSETTAGPRTIRTKATSGPARTVTIESRNGNPIYVRVPTLLEESHWDTILAGQDNVTNSYVDSNDRLVIELRPGTYSLRMAEVGFGPNVDDEPAAYVTALDDTSQTTLPGSTVELEGQVRDKYNNPVANQQVTVSVSGGGSVASGTVVSDENGAFTVRYTAPSTTGTATVTASAQGANSETWTITSSSSTDPNSGDRVSGVNPTDGSLHLYTTFDPGAGDDLALCFVNEAGGSRTFDQARFAFYYTTQTAATSADVSTADGTPIASGVDVPGTFVPLSPKVTVADNNTTRLDIDFDRTSANDFFVLSIRYTGGANLETASYFVSLDPISGGSACPAPP